MPTLTRVPKRLHACPACGGKVDAGHGEWACADRFVCCARGPVAGDELLVRERRSRTSQQPALVRRLEDAQLRRLARRLGLKAAS